jgi:hypothetical protein
MTGPLPRIVAAIAITFVAGFPSGAVAQESRIAAELRREAEHLRESCGALKTLMGCAMTVVTGRPVHVSFGSIAPGNGVALGASFGTSHAPNETWRLSWSGDAVRTFGGSWRAGAYMKLIHTPQPVITVVTDPAAASTAGDLAVRPHTVINLYGQTTSLQDLSFYALGDPASRASFGMQQTIVGASLIAPIFNSALIRRLNLSLLGEVHGRFVSIRDGKTEEAPSLLLAYDDASAPGLHTQPDFFQMGGGVRLKPVPSRYFRLNYLATGQQFIADTGDFSFRRWTLDLDHEIAFYGTSRPVEARDINTPNDCLTAAGGDACPAPTVSRDRRGSLNVRVLAVTSSTGTGARVSFYLQPTLGGTDINGQPTLASFDDYRFRGPHVLLFQQTFEHSVWGPLGAWVRTDQGMVSQARNRLGLSGLRESFAAGITIRAGGFPMVVASYAVGGGEGRHFSLTINTALLGGSSRPPLD